MAKRAVSLAVVAVAAAWFFGCGQGGEQAATEAAAENAEAKGGPEAATAVAPAAAPTTTIQTQEANVPGLAAELTEATREEGVLTVKVRFRNQGAEPIHHSFETGHGDYSYFYVTAGDQKYFILKDAEGAPLAPKYLTVDLDPGATTTWWGKFPAPPSTETMFDLVMPDVTPFEDVPITDQ